MSLVVLNVECIEKQYSKRIKSSKEWSLKVKTNYKTFFSSSQNFLPKHCKFDRKMKQSEVSGTYNFPTNSRNCG